MEIQMSTGLLENWAPMVRTGILVFLIIFLQLIYLLSRSWYQQNLLKKHLIAMRKNLENNSDTFNQMIKLGVPNEKRPQATSVEKSTGQYYNLFDFVLLETRQLFNVTGETNPGIILKTNQLFFHMRMKEKFSGLLNHIKFLVWISFVVGLCNIMFQLNWTIPVGKAENFQIEFRDFLHLFSDAILISGIPIVIVLILSIWGYFHIKKGCSHLLSEIDYLVDIYQKAM